VCATEIHRFTDLAGERVPVENHFLHEVIDILLGLDNAAARNDRVVAKAAQGFAEGLCKYRLKRPGVTEGSEKSSHALAGGRIYATAAVE